MTSKEDLKNQLEHILNEVAKTQNIKNFEINPKTEATYGDGFVSQFYTGTVQNKNKGETIAVAIKKAPTTTDIDYGLAFKTEDTFYNIIFPTLNNLQNDAGVSKPFNNLPKCFCGDLEPNRQYIAMENLQALGYVMFDKKQCLDTEHLEMIFKTYGKFHTLSYVLRNKNKEKYDTLSTDISFDIYGQVEKFVAIPMDAVISAAINALDSDSDKVVYDEIRDLKTNVFQNLLASYNYSGDHRCLIHGDCWSNNMLFKYSDSGKLLDIKLIDFQLCQDKTPIFDLSYFFYSGAAKKDMDDMDNYLQIYYKSFSDFAKELGANLQEIFSFEVLKNEWKQNALFGVILGIYLWQVKLIPKEDYIHILIPDEERDILTSQESMKLWEVLLNKVLETDLYKTRTTAILRHAVKYGVITKDKIVRKKI